MANELPITLVLSGALPAGFTGTPQQLAEAIIARARLQTSQSFSLFATGSTEPSSNVGPWLKDGKEWMIWSDDTGNYVPLTINNSSFTAGQITNTMLAADSVGTTQIIDGSVTDAKLAVSAKSPFRATTSATSQAIATTAAVFSWNDIEFPTENFDPNNNYNPTTSRFTAPVAGFYFVSYFIQFDNSTTSPSAPANMQIGTEVFDPATSGWYGIGATMNYGRATAGIWFVGTSGLIYMNAGQSAKIRAYAIDGVGGTQIDVSVFGHWSMYLVQQIIP